MDKLMISGIELWLRLGCTNAERAFAQRLEMDIEVEADLRSAGRKDDICRTLDYAEVVARLKKVLEPKTFRLSERVAEEAAGIVLKNFRLKKVLVRLKKKALPGVGGFVVEIRRP